MSTTSDKATYTPGPWGYEETTLGICRLIVTVEDVQAFQVSPKKDDGELTAHAIAYVPCDYDRESQEANARLIAAAPDLLAALKMMLESHDRSCRGKDCWIVGVDVARFAIAKAEGR